MTKRRNHYKFTKKKKSVRGIIAVLLSVASAASFVVMVINSFELDGGGSIYLGSAGVLSLLFSIAALVLSFFSIKEEDTFKAIPYTGFVFSIITTLVWALVYGVGFLL